MVKKVLLAASLIGAALAALSPAYSTPEIARKEERSCVTCHTAVGRAELNDAGKYYKEHQTLDGFPGQLPPRSGQRPAPPAANPTR